jgi:hypothetical protein
MDMLRVRAENGEPVEAPVAVWISALLQTLTPVQLGDVFAKVEQMNRDAVKLHMPTGARVAATVRR